MPTDKTIPRIREAYPFWTTVTIRYSDQDPMRHVNNVAITAFLESGRAALLRHLFEGTSMSPYGMVLAGLKVDYLNEIKFPGEVEIGGRISRMGGRSITSQYAIFKDGACCVVSESTNVFFDPETRRSAEPPQDVRENIEAFLAEYPTV